MRRKRNKRSVLNVTLFPFLAVLICTLGVLIVLLVLAVRAADVQASVDQSEHEQEQQRLKELRQEKEFELDSNFLKSEFLSEARPQLVEELSKSREYRGHLEGELRRLNKQRQQLSDALQSQDSVDLDELNQDAELMEGRIAQLQQAIEGARAELEQKRTAIVASDKKLYSIVPHVGAGGTFRRPIFIEATAQSLVIQPLGIRLDRNDFAPPVGPGNPLDAALLAIRDYWLKHDVQRAEGSPYPLVVIRPDGAEGYAIARHAMSSWEDEFGYEMVEQEKQLDFGEPDPALKELVAEVVAEAKAKQRAVLVTRAAGQHLAGTQPGFSVGSSRTRRSDQRPGLTASGSAGGFVINSAGQQGDHGSDRMPFNPGGDRFQDQNLSNSRGDQQAASVANSSADGRGGFDQQANSNSERAGGEILAGNFQSSSSTGPSGGQGSAGGMSQGAYMGNAVGQEQQSQGGQGSPTEASDNDAPQCLYQHMNLAQQRGSNWALPAKAVNQTGYVRPIRLVCSASELEVRSSLGTEKKIPIGEDVSQVVDPLINEIWRQIESWGLPGSQSYWKPELRISVLPGGELNFEKLQGLLFNSGVDVRESQQ